MKQHVLFKLFTLGLVALVLFATNCAKPAEQKDKEVIAQLTDYLNSRDPLGQFKIDPATTIVTLVGNNRYQITLKNTFFITDLTGVVDIVNKYISSKDSPFSELDTSRMEEVILIYGPEDNYLNLRSIKGLSIENELEPKLSSFGGLELNKIGVSIGKITYQGQDTRDSRSSETVEHLKIDLSGLTAKKDKISILLDIEKIGKVDAGKEDHNLSDYLMNKNAPRPDLKKALETGAAINDLNIQLGKVYLSIKKNGSKICDSSIKNAAYLQFMKPDDTRKSFKYGQGIQLKNLKLSIPGKKEFQLLSHVKECCFEFSINNLSPGATLAFLDLMKKSFTLRNQVDSTKVSEYTSLVTRLLFEIMKSKVYMQFSISPFKHYFGEMKAVADIRLYNLMAGPIVKITLTLFKVDDILNKLKEADVLSADTLKIISGIIERYAVRHGNGDASFIYEMDIHQLRKMLLQGNPLIPPTSHNFSDFPHH
ncbi:MAG: hypothetical protein GTO45_18155 [Candidatus Aminicenantes bacterium]|nr:hypothetical protein [Candidatus Aminicenantes bacterium]NIM80711.1 hypothetical protein [Candidatus Aminicenantes bacterium]NIN20086.1 hypothetical protein [Candidatus Aminicenantes bacterium]NIN43873.1 hypothetical protein [Candidatus Aminicenantes bacterium]NIN86682.1 hypothetical protein [Candidatus Aminicenantes bacterium]